MVKSRSGQFGDGRSGDGERRSRPTLQPLDLQAEDLDPITGTLLWTRFADLLESETSSGPGGALLVVDLDRQGQAVANLAQGDQSEIVQLLAGAVRQAIRAGDLVTHLETCRFAVLLRGASQDIADGVAARIMESVDNTVFLLSQGIAQLSVAIGGVVFSHNKPASGDLLGSATANLDVASDAEARVCIR